MRNAQAPLWPEVTEKPGMGSFGERMQREREMRSITLDEIAEHTKISKRNLTALEEENFAQLPGGIFNKGFVRAYARYLGIDEEQAVADYLAADAEKQRKRMPIPIDQASAGLRPESVADRPAIVEGEPQPDQAAGFMTAAVALVVVLGIGGLAYKWMQSRNPDPPAHVAEARTQPEQTPVATQELPVQPISAPSSVPTPSSDLSSPTGKMPEVAIAPAATPLGSFSLVLKTKEESWVQVKADGKLLMEGVLAPNTNKSFDASKELVIKLGNAAGVELAYNGKLLPQFENTAKGTTKTLTFTPQGLAESVR
jgi:cytoskeleton protein RodZ